jgi:hypothetical protein
MSNNSELISINEEMINNILIHMPKNIDLTSKMSSTEILLSGVDKTDKQKKNDEIITSKILQDENSVLLLCKQIGKKLINKNPMAALELIDNSIKLSMKLYGGSNPELVSLYLTQYEVLDVLGNVDQMYESLNNAFLLATFNFGSESMEMLQVLDGYRSFSKKIDEQGEHETYAEKMENIIQKLYTKNTDNKNKELLLQLLNYQIKILDSLTSFSEETYTVEALKKYNKKFEDLQGLDLLKQIVSSTGNNNWGDQNLIKDEIFFDNHSEIYYYILYANIKLKSFFKKDARIVSYKEMQSLIQLIKKKEGVNSPYLIKPYLFILKYYQKINDSTKLEKILLEDWVTLIDSLTYDNNILIANHTLTLIKSLLTKNKDLRVRLSNLLNFAGENYSKVCKFESDSKLNNSFIYAELCYLGAYINSDDPKMAPWNMAASAVNNYVTLLGQESEKCKKTLALYDMLIKLHNVNLSESDE